MSKVFERIIFETLYENLRHKLYPAQYGFRQKRSATLQLLTFLNKIYTNYDDEAVKELGLIYLDFAKAFDTVRLDILIRKLQEVGIGGKLQLLASYLSQRKQFVKVGEESSGLKEVTSGVPQGSILGPLLFLVFINDLPNSLQNCYGFADDFKVVVKSHQELNESTATINDWCATNGTQLILNKCGILVLSGQMNGKLSNENIALLETQKDLGLVITKSPTWHNNCQQRTNKALKALFNLEGNQSSNCCINVKINAFTGYVMPILTYCSQSWLPRNSGIRDMERVQKIAAKWFYGSHIEYHERLLKCNLLPVSMYYELHDILYLDSLLKGKYDKDINNFISKTSVESTRQSSRSELEVTRTRTQKADENFFIRSSNLHNIMSRALARMSLKFNKSNLTYLYWNYFTIRYSETNPCTWRIICKCNHCNPTGKLSHIGTIQ